MTAVNLHHFVHVDTRTLRRGIPQAHDMTLHFCVVITIRHRASTSRIFIEMNLPRVRAFGLKLLLEDPERVFELVLVFLGKFPLLF